MTPSRDRYLADKTSSFSRLQIADAFEQLTSKEKKYAHYLGQASWGGLGIIQGQYTQHAQALYKLLLLIFADTSLNHANADLSAAKTASQLTDAEYEDLLQYASQVVSNLANYKSFGATKFIPRVSQDKFEAFVNQSPNASQAKPLWDQLKSHIYSLEPEAALTIGKPSKGHTSNYYMGETITDSEVAVVQQAAEKLGIDVLNTRVSKQSSEAFTLHIASVNGGVQDNVAASPHVSVKHGDFATQLKRVNEALTEAKKHAANPTQVSMLDGYIKSFDTGSIEDHKEGSRHWVKDVGPVVESYIGFIETYLDPYGGRAEWEGFTAIVNKELSVKYEELVSRASELIEDFPWGKDFEVDVFKKPDFTALDVLSFATGGIPIGINIPNYYDIRESVGFKNVSLLNIMNARPSDEKKKTLLHDDDQEVFKKWDLPCMEISTATHELLGHGSGKLFTEAADGTLNFDPKKVINPLTGKHVTSWYKPGQTPDSVLGEVSSSMEECRAETVSTYLAGNREINKLFGYDKQEDVDDLEYVTYLDMSRNGLRALEYYDPVTKIHGQAHMQARLAIFNWFLRHGLARLEEVRNADGVLEDLYVRLDRAKVLKDGKEISGKLLTELQVRKSTADGEGAREFYTEVSRPDDAWLGEIRDLVISKKQPRVGLVQPNTFVEGDEVVLKEYEASAIGMITSAIERPGWQ
ncbi:aflatoxin-detoxifizyme [Pterulicium gracile]|uniref:Dipeptidyl peptidase 3 n=1 Tax=Pterulicium gracile TaxID=1884261 RepID=A0A5C3QAC7_9AGAR|nr:aflatoxin-detoxifizyme [Pterula gracilis]